MLKEKNAAPVSVDSTEIRTPMGALTPLKDAADFNATFGWETNSGLPTHVQDLVGTDVNGKPVLPEGANTPGTVSWQLDSGWSQDISDGVITYGFFDGKHAVGLNNNPAYGEGKGYTPFSEAQKTAARSAIENWDDLVAPEFVEVQQGPGVSTWAQKTTDILLANTWSGPAQAWAYYPGYEHQNERVAGDVWIADPRFNTSNSQFLPGQYGLQTLNHELGHSLGLSHPGNYNFGDDTDGDGVADPITYTGDAFYFQDSNQFTIMSYFDSYETGAQNIDYNFLRFLYPSTPMVDDVYVVQQKYGADMTTRTGDTTYGFNATADVANEAMKFHDGEMATIFTIWDADGNDTLNLSGYDTPSVIDLREGAYSSAGGWGSYDAGLLSIDPATDKGEYLAAVNSYNGKMGSRTGAYDLYFGGREGVNEGIPWSEITNSVDAHYLMQQNIGIAYGAVIENAIGGAGDDRINGNQEDNVFTGNGGADTFIIADYSGIVPNPAHPDGVEIIDHSTDTITDFATGVDKIDLTSFGDALSGLSYDGTDLHFSANDNDYLVHLNGATVDLNNDILFG
jgi:serralysin